MSILPVSCSFYPSSPVETMAVQNNYSFNFAEMSRRYPYWNTGLGEFIADPNEVNPGVPLTPELQAEHQKITALDKRLMLQKMDLIRFVINTPEFEANFMKATFWGDANASGPGGKLELNKPLDNKRYLEIIRRRKYNVTIRKMQLSLNAAAVGVVGAKIYVLADDDRQISNSYWIAFPNREIWSKGGYLQETYMAGVVFHEMLHNTGFNHNTAAHDPVYEAQGVFTGTYNSDFRIKYAKELAAFRGFYENQYSFWLTYDTIAPGSKTRARSAVPTPMGAPGEVICILNKDGTHTQYTVPK